MKRLDLLLLILAGSLSFASCIDERYDLEKLDNEMTILPGISIPVNSTTEISLNDSYASKNGVLGADSNNDYRLNFSPFSGISPQIKRSDFENTSKHYFGGELALYKDDILNFSNSSELSLTKSPTIVLEVNNPTEDGLLLNASVNKGYNCVGWLRDIPVPPGKSAINLSEELFTGLFTPFSDDIFINSFIIYHDSPLINNEGLDDNVLEFSISAYIPLEFNAGEGATFSFVSDFFVESGVVDALEGYDLNVNSVEISASVTNSFPFDIDLSIENWDGTRIFNMDKTIAAGTAGQPVATDLCIKSSEIRDLKNIEQVVIKCSAIVPESFSSAVTLRRDQKMTILIKDITLPEGFTLSDD